jgi:hypothetical protein
MLSIMIKSEMLTFEKPASEKRSFDLSIAMLIELNPFILFLS